MQLLLRYTCYVSKSECEDTEGPAFSRYEEYSKCEYSERPAFFGHGEYEVVGRCEVSEGTTPLAHTICW